MITMRYENNGYVNIKEIESVQLVPEKYSETGFKKLFVFPTNDEAYSLEQGMVYIMNSNGKTVAQFYLGDVLKELE